LISQRKIYWKGNQYTIDKAAALSNVETLSVFNTKGGALNLSGLSSYSKLSTLYVINI